MKQKEVVLVGAGGHALSLAEFASEEIYGYLSDCENEKLAGRRLGSDQEAKSLVSEDYSFHIAFVYSGWPVMKKRRELIEYYNSLGARFITLTAPSAIVTPGSTVGDGSAIMAGAIVNRAVLGKNVIVNSGAIVEHDCVIGENTFIGPGAVVGGFTEIGENCFIGLGARVGNGLKIVSGVTVAMGAIVNRNINEPGIYHGFPLKRVKEI